MVDGERKSSSAGWLSALSFGFFLVFVGVIWIITPDLSSKVIDFVRGFHLENLTENILLPAPEPGHLDVYTAAMQFCLIFGAFQVFMLILRFIFHDSLDKKSSTVSSMAFWFSAGYFLNLLANEYIGWFGFLAGLIISVGLNIIAGSLVKLFARA